MVLVLLFLVSCAYAQTQPKTVTEFYLALTGGIYGIEGTQDAELPGFDNDFFFYSNERNESPTAIRRYRKSLIKIEVTKNGYLRLESNEREGWVEIALFKKFDGTYLVAISQVGRGPACRGGILFLAYNHGKWTNVTERAFTYPTATKDYYKLSGVGTTVELLCGVDSSGSCRNGETLAEFQWNKGTFIKKPATR